MLNNIILRIISESINSTLLLILEYNLANWERNSLYPLLMPHVNQNLNE